MTESISPRPRVISGNRFVEALLAAGIVKSEDKVRRVVIDAAVGNAVVMYVERFGDERLLNVASTLDGVEIREVSS